VVEEDILGDDEEMRRMEEEARIDKMREENLLIEKMRREAREQQARNDRLVQEAREAAAARLLAEQMLVADQGNSEAELQKILELRRELTAQKEEITSLTRRVEDSKVREQRLSCVLLRKARNEKKRRNVKEMLHWLEFKS
jgi:hypothetical protein